METRMGGAKWRWRPFGRWIEEFAPINTWPMVPRTRAVHRETKYDRLQAKASRRRWPAWPAQPRVIEARWLDEI